MQQQQIPHRIKIEFEHYLLQMIELGGGGGTSI